MNLAITSPVVKKKKKTKLRVIELQNLVEHHYVKITDSSCHGHWLWLMPDQRQAKAAMDIDHVDGTSQKFGKFNV